MTVRIVSHLKRCLLVLTVSVGVAAWASPAALATPYGGQVATATKAVYIQGSFKEAGSQRWLPIEFLLPSGTVAGTGPVSGSGVDLRSPLAGLDSIWGQKDCYALANPTSFSLGTQGSRSWGLTNVSFDIPCDDGSGYDFYRVTITDRGPWQYSENLGGFPFDWPGAFGYAPDRDTIFRVTGIQTGLELANLQICGHDASGFTCLKPGDTHWAQLRFLTGATLSEVSARNGLL